jgi:hypothetical protein
MTEAADITALLLAWGEEQEPARSQLVEAVYGELRRVAQRRVQWQNRAQFLAIAARVMRRILVDQGVS